MLHLGMEHIRKIMEIMDDDEMFPTRNEWAYIKISNELKTVTFKIKRTVTLPKLQSTLRHHPALSEMRGETYTIYASDHGVKSINIHHDSFSDCSTIICCLPLGM